MKPLAIVPDVVNIIAPLITSKKYMGSHPFRITNKSLKQHRMAVYKIARFFRKEFGYDFVQYHYEEKDDETKSVAFLWVHPEAVFSVQDFRVPCIGATCFRWRKWEEFEGWAMQWIWMHPFYRRKGLLTKAWPKFRKEFGEFKVEPPLSDAMRAFLAKIDLSGKK